MHTLRLRKTTIVNATQPQRSIHKAVGEIFWY